MKQPDEGGKKICKSSSYKERFKHWSYFVAKQRMFLERCSCAWVADVWEQNPPFQVWMWRTRIERRGRVCFLWGGNVFVSVTMTQGGTIKAATGQWHVQFVFALLPCGWACTTGKGRFVPRRFPLFHWTEHTPCYWMHLPLPWEMQGPWKHS